MNLLAFDTSSPSLSVALKVGENPTQEIAIEGLRSHSEQLLPSIEKLLEEAKLSVQEIDVFLIGQGPGSFTGLRVGFATLKGLLAGNSKESWGALSLDLVAAQTPGSEGDVLAVAFDARRERVNASLYKRNATHWEPIEKAGAMTLDEFIVKLPQGCKVVGDVVRIYTEKLNEVAIEKKLSLSEKKDMFPRASTLISCYTDLPKSGILKKLNTPTDFLPLYFRLSEPEERIKHANGC